MRTTRALIATSAVLIAALALGASAFARTVTQHASAALGGGGTVTATLTYSPHPAYDANTRLTITRAGATLYSRPVSGNPCRRYCRVQDATSVHAVDLQGNGEPSVFVDLSTGEAHCCSITNFYTYDPGTQTYRAYEYGWGDPGYTFKRVGGQDVFETADDRFAYAFTDYAGAGLPLRVLSFDCLRMINVTRRYLAAIAADATRHLKAFTAQAPQYIDTVGDIAAWAADEDELGNHARVATYLDAQARERHLNSLLKGEAENAAFVRTLDAFLNKTGYLR